MAKKTGTTDNGAMMLKVLEKIQTEVSGIRVLNHDMARDIQKLVTMVGEAREQQADHARRLARIEDHLGLDA